MHMRVRSIGGGGEGGSNLRILFYMISLHECT